MLNNLQIAKYGLIIAIFSLILFPSLPVFAQPNIGDEYVVETGLQTLTQDPRVLAISIVNYLMTFLGIIAVSVILFGGFKWMTAAGNEDRVAEAKRLLAAGIIGLVIIIGAYAIVTFIISTTGNVITGNLN